MNKFKTNSTKNICNIQIEKMFRYIIWPLEATDLQGYVDSAIF